MLHEQAKGRLWTPGTIFLLLVTLAGGAAIAYRMVVGLGATTNMDDTYAWGIWKAVNVCGIIALGAGGFTSAAIIYIFKGEKYHCLARSAVLWAILCYASAGFSLMFDIGIPWRLVYPIVLWPEHSILFEVAWCVMLYLSVLFLELLPAFFERFDLKGLAATWRALVPVYTVCAITFFAYIMTHSPVIAAVAFVMFGLMAIVLPKMVSQKVTVPIMLVMFGVLLSTLHQSSLGSLFLLMQEKLSHLWWTEALPFNFIISAMAVGLSVVVIERTFSTKAFGRKMEHAQLAGLAKMSMILMWIYLAVRLGDMAYRGRLGLIKGDTHSMLFIVEIALMLVPALMLSLGAIRNSVSGRVFAGLIAVVGILLNRVNVCIYGMDFGDKPVYVPSPIEILITVSVFTGIILVYTLVSRLFPIMPVQGQESHVSGGMAAAAPA